MRKPAQKAAKSDTGQPQINTPEWLRTFNGFSSYNDQEAFNIIQTLNTLAGLLFDANAEHSFVDCTRSASPINLSVLVA